MCGYFDEDLSEILKIDGVDCIPVTKPLIKFCLRCSAPEQYAVIPSCKAQCDELEFKAKELHYSFMELFEGIDDNGERKSSKEKHLILLPYYHYFNSYFTPPEAFFGKIMALGKEYYFDRILVKLPDKCPEFYNPETGEAYGCIQGNTFFDQITEVFGKTVFIRDFPKRIREFERRFYSGELVHFDTELYE